MMDSRLAPLLLGGMIPAVLYGLAGVIQKASARAGGSASMYLIGFGVATVLTGVAFRTVLTDGYGPTRAFALALLGGLAFGLGAGLISLALIRFDAPVSQLSPLYNMNTLVAVALGFVVFAEFRDVQALRLVAGAVLIVAGGWLVSSA